MIYSKNASAAYIIPETRARMLLQDPNMLENGIAIFNIIQKHLSEPEVFFKFNVCCNWLNIQSVSICSSRLRNGGG